LVDFFLSLLVSLASVLNLLDESKRNGLRDFASTKREGEDVFKKKKNCKRIQMKMMVKEKESTTQDFLVSQKPCIVGEKKLVIPSRGGNIRYLELKSLSFAYRIESGTFLHAKL
jgi:hypothetical protein